MPPIHRRHSVPDSFGLQQHFVTCRSACEVNHSRLQLCQKSQTSNNNTCLFISSLTPFVNDCNLNHSFQSQWTGKISPVGCRRDDAIRDANCNVVSHAVCVRRRTRIRRSSLTDNCVGNIVPQDRSRATRKTIRYLAASVKEESSRTETGGSERLRVQRSLSTPPVHVTPRHTVLTDLPITGSGIPSLPCIQNTVPTCDEVRTTPNSSSPLTESDYINGNTQIADRGSHARWQSGRSQGVVNYRRGDPGIETRNIRTRKPAFGQILSTGTQENSRPREAVTSTAPQPVKKEREEEESRVSAMPQGEDVLEDSLTTSDLVSSTEDSGVHTCTEDSGVHTCTEDSGVHTCTEDSGVHTCTEDSGVHTCTEDSGVHTCTACSMASSTTASDSEDRATPAFPTPASSTPATPTPLFPPYHTPTPAVTDLHPRLLSFPDLSEDELKKIMSSDVHPEDVLASSPHTSDLPPFRPPSPLTVQDEEENSTTVQSDFQQTFYEDSNASHLRRSAVFKPVSPQMSHDHGETEGEDCQVWSVSQERACIAPRPCSPITIMENVCNAREPKPEDHASLHRENIQFHRENVSFYPVTTNSTATKTQKTCAFDINHKTDKPTSPVDSRKHKVETGCQDWDDREHNSLSGPKRNRTDRTLKSAGKSPPRSDLYRECGAAGRLQEVFMKMVMVGDYRVGKSQLLQALCKALSPGKEGFRCTAYRPREFAELTLQREGRRTRVKIMDTVGQERYRSLTSSYFRGVQGCFLVFNINQKESFDHIMQWYEDMQEYSSDVISTLLVGVSTAWQRREEREVTSQRALKLADSLQTQYLETTLRDQDMLACILERMVHRVSTRLPLSSLPPPIFSITPTTTTTTTTSSYSSKIALVRAKKRRRHLVACAS